MGNMNWLMMVTVAILMVGALLGYINGLIKTILNLVIGAVTLILVLILSPRVCTFLQEQTGLPDYVGSRTEAVVREQVQELLAEQPGFVFDEAGQEALVEKLPFLPALKEAVSGSEQVQDFASQGTEYVITFISDAVAGQIIVLLAYFVTFVAVFLALRVVVFLLNILEHLPVIHGVNKLAGLVVGLAEGVIAVWILGTLLSVAGTTQLGQSAAQCIRESGFLTAIYGHNLVLRIIFWSLR
ncbi:MAG: CvpA family protein [Lachnospiraceae bacterium]|jgi:hypothetical protein|nr:CvpA family protein [Lachnospiraceae bacterium]